jgi:DNA polymerase III subunit gamma/tau
MEQALYRKYRPKSFDETVGQDHITKTLQKALKSGRISHAYLFTGPRGVGKTSVARILAHEVNGLAYKDDSIHLDIIEIDAASNRRIDEIRDLRDRVRIAPTSSKYKVYIIDEVHMLTREAFNALLKTLEEPPAHCIFILATTEAHKLPETIISRTQRHEFKPVNKVQMSDHLAGIAKSEKIDISREALELLAEYGEGSFRDSIGYLDQLSSHSRKITEAEVREVLGMPAAREVGELLASIRWGDVKAVADNLTRVQGQGAGAVELAAALSKELRDLVVSGGGGLKETRLLKALMDVKASGRPAEYLEIILFDAAAAYSPADAPVPNGPAAKTIPADDKPKITRAAGISRPAIDLSEPAASGTLSGSFSLELWPQVITKAKDQAASIYTALRLASPAFDGGKLTLSFQFPLHQKKLNQIKNKAMVIDIINELCGQAVLIDCIVDKTVKNPPAPEATSSENPLHSISNIFGTAEMMEI